MERRLRIATGLHGETLVPTIDELALAERVRADAEQSRAESERVRAENERERAESERVRAENERERADRLEAALRALAAPKKNRRTAKRARRG